MQATEGFEAALTDRNATAASVASMNIKVARQVMILYQQSRVCRQHVLTTLCCAILASISWASRLETT